MEMQITVSIVLRNVRIKQTFTARSERWGASQAVRMGLLNKSIDKEYFQWSFEIPDAEELGQCLITAYDSPEGTQWCIDLEWAHVAVVT